MSGSFGEMGNLLAQAQKMQKALDEARQELKSLTVEGTAGGGAVTVTVTADGEVEGLHIADDAFAENDKAGLEELVVAALRDGHAKATRVRDERLSKVTGGLNLPGLM